MPDEESGISAGSKKDIARREAEGESVDMPFIASCSQPGLTYCSVLLSHRVWISRP